eukprot:Rmarinus@m.16283
MERLRASLEDKLVDATERIFPESKRIPRGARRCAGSSQEIASNLPLQVLLYFNVFSSGFFLCLSWPILFWKLDHLSLSYEEIILPVIVTLFTVAEPLRLYFGFVGNLREKVPQLAASFILGWLPILPADIYLTFLQTTPVPIESALGYINICFHLVEIVLSFISIKYLISSQAAKFYLEVDLMQQASATATEM